MLQQCTAEVVKLPKQAGVESGSTGAWREFKKRSPRKRKVRGALDAEYSWCLGSLDDYRTWVCGWCCADCPIRRRYAAGRTGARRACERDPSRSAGNERAADEAVR